MLQKSHNFPVDRKRKIGYNIHIFSKKESVMDIKAINTAILQGNFTNDQLTSIVDAVKYARAQLVDANKRSFHVGTAVEFTNSRTGMTVKGKVRKIAIKFVTVDTGQTLWKVPANMLRAA
jgi:hypothetical protein